MVEHTNSIVVLHNIGTRNGEFAMLEKGKQYFFLVIENLEIARFLKKLGHSVILYALENVDDEEIDVWQEFPFEQASYDKMDYLVIEEFTKDYSLLPCRLPTIDILDILYDYLQDKNIQWLVITEKRNFLYQKLFSYLNIVDCDLKTLLREIDTLSDQTLAFFLEEDRLRFIQNLKPDIVVIPYQNFSFVSILSRMKEEGNLILNIANDEVIAYIKRILVNVYYFSIYREMNGCYIQNQMIYYQSEEILKITDFPLEGVSLESVLAVVVLAKKYSLDSSILREVLKGADEKENFLENMEEKLPEEKKKCYTSSRPLVLVAGKKNEEEKKNENSGC